MAIKLYEVEAEYVDFGKEKDTNYRNQYVHIRSTEKK